MSLVVWLVAGSAAFVVVGLLVLRWFALAVARQVATATERHVATTLARGVRASHLPRGIDPARRARYLAQIERLAWVMDRAVPLPLVRGVGLDAVLGLLPGIGDVAGFAAGAFIVVRAAQMGASPELITRLIAIQCTDALLGAIPLAGDVFDIVYKADVRSAELIREALGSAGPPNG